ncbi:MAG TPA: prepilin peptidase [Bacillales bacterium]|nr:prepilin peptidase [Bacillales bacterium]
MIVEFVRNIAVMLDAMLIIVLIICTVTDLKTRKIYNIVVYPAFLAAFLLHFMNGGVPELGTAFGGLLVGFGILIVPYLFGGMGAGDVKLLAFVGAAKGSVFVFHSAIYMALAGAAVAVGILVFRKGAAKRLKSMTWFLFSHLHGLRMPLNIDKHALTLTYPYGIAIAAGTIICLMFNGR